MAHTHEYDCIVCGAHFDNSKDLSRHNQEQHIKTATGMEKPREANTAPEDADKKEPLPEGEL
jgi:hypothetical protein